MKYCQLLLYILPLKNNGGLHVLTSGNSPFFSP
jgi:hypothetical protein